MDTQNRRAQPGLASPEESLKRLANRVNVVYAPVCCRCRLDNIRIVNEPAHRSRGNSS